MAIDREATQRRLSLGGLGQPAYLAGQTLNDPVILEHGDKWVLPIRRRGRKGTARRGRLQRRFRGQHSGRDSATRTSNCPNAIAADWQQQLQRHFLTVHDRRTYSTIRPGLVTRTFPVLRMHPCCGGPSTWPLEQIWSSYGRNGYNHAIEVPKAAEVNKIKNETADQEVAVSGNRRYAAVFPRMGAYARNY